MNPTPKLTKLVAILAVQNHRESSRFYTEKLGFTVDHADDDWIMLERDEARIRLGNCPDEKSAWDTGLHNWFATILVDDIHGLEKEFLERDVPFMQRIENKGDWIDFVIQTPDGHRLVFGHLPKGKEA